MEMRRLSSAILALSGVVILGLSGLAQDRSKYFAIKVIDGETGRGVPLVEFRTTSRCRYYTDSYGRIAFYEPSLMNQRVYFDVFSHGYLCEKNQFGERGVFLQTTPGDSITIKILRLNIADRLYRITGQDIYGESVRLGYPAPIKHQGLNGKVTGQDTFIETVHNGKIYWFWGDTGGPANFNGSASGATSLLPGKGGLDPNVGIDFTYFVDSTGFSRPMCPIPGPGLVWIDWLVTIPDGKGGDKLYGKFSRTKNLGEDYERGIAVFDDVANKFKKIVSVDAWLDKVHSSGHPVRVRENGQEYIYIIDRYGFERVIADSQHITNAASYEHFTCLAPGTRFGGGTSTFDRATDGHLVYAWKPSTDALGPKQQSQLVASRIIAHPEGLWQTEDVESGQPVAAEPCSVFWNAYRKCWIMLAYEWSGTVWYFEGDTPVGPWVFGQRIVTHENYDFYNCGQHPLFDKDGGRVIYFEGTYTTGFSGNKNPTPLYDYNQMMYRLTLDDPRLSLPAPVYRVKDAQGRSRYLMRAAVDSLNGWGSIEQLSFFAIPSNRISEQVIPIYSQTDKDGDRLTTQAPAGGADHPAFFALTAESLAAADPISGVWECVATLSDGSRDSVQFDLTLKGDAVVGQGVTKGVYRDGKLDLEMKAYGFMLDGSLSEGRLVGKLAQQGGNLSGTWVGRRVVSPTDKGSSSAVSSLFEYQVKNTGRRIYSVDASLAGDTLIKSEKPLCRVWRNPYSLLLLDSDAKPVAITTR
ncbi:MAG TPA: hypothetical protein VMS71_05935 [Candidatus Acidoferrum sp.]|nr:hypothetical protein [Candidatus Acidoferrum sp.]